MIQAVIFDMDDTLYPESEYVLSGFRAVSKWANDEFGIPEKDGYDKLRLLFEAGVRGDTFDQWLEHFHLTSRVGVPELVAVYREHRPTIKPFSGVLDLLRNLSLNYRIGLVSDGYHAVQERKWQALGLDRYFDAVVFSDSLGRDAWKPSRKPFELVLTELGVSAESAIYVGDNPHKDFIGARQMGLHTIWLRHSDGIYSHVEPPTQAHQPDLTVNSWEELDQHLERIKNYL